METQTLTDKQKERASKYIVLTGDDFTDYQSVVILEMLRQNVIRGTANDISKYNLVEAYKTSLVWTVNLRSLRNFMSLRTDKSALWEIRELACAVYEQIPEDHKYLLVDTVKKVTKQMRTEVYDMTGQMMSDDEILKYNKGRYE